MIALDLANDTDQHTRRALSSLSLSVAKCKKILVMTGAGISCSCGIPDFRSSDGLYALVKRDNPDVVLKGRDLFDAALFRDPSSTTLFYKFIAQLKRAVDRADPAPTHRFIKTLDSKKKLLRSYTQNIDGLEERAGLVGTESDKAKCDAKGKGKLKIKEVRNVQLHGDIHRVRCTLCAAQFPYEEEYLKSHEQGIAPPCPDCLSRSEARQARSARALTTGSLRPAIVLYDEPHPLGEDIGSITSQDMGRKPDMLIIMGTSLKVHGFRKLVREFARVVHEGQRSSSLTSTSALGPSSLEFFTPGKSPVGKNGREKRAKAQKTWSGKVIYVNRTPPGAEWGGIIDYWVQGEADRWCERVEEEWKKMRPQDWEVQKTLEDTVAEGQDGFRAGKATAGGRLKVKGKDVFGTKKVARKLPPIPMPLSMEDTPHSPSTRPRSLSPLSPLPPSSQPYSDASSPPASLPPSPSSSAPPTPTKRPHTKCHYTSTEGSPRKKRSSESLHRSGAGIEEWEGKGLLFADTTNKPLSFGPRDEKGKQKQKDKEIGSSDWEDFSEPDVPLRANAAALVAKDGHAKGKKRSTSMRTPAKTPAKSRVGLTGGGGHGVGGVRSPVRTRRRVEVVMTSRGGLGMVL